MDLPWLYRKVYQNWNRSSGRKWWAGRRIEWFGVGREEKTKSNARLKSMEKKSSQTAASKQKPKQETLIDWCCFYYFVRNSLVALLEALCIRQMNIKGNIQCSGKCSGDRVSSNVEWAKSMLCVGLLRGRRRKGSFEESGKVSGGKDECQLRLNDDDCFHSCQQ